jgi:hypothetical protein
MIAIAVGDSQYVVVLNKTQQIIRKGKFCGAVAAIQGLKPRRDETLYIKVGKTTC